MKWVLQTFSIAYIFTLEDDNTAVNLRLFEKYVLHIFLVIYIGGDYR